MQFINYFFASIISFSGLLIGVLLVEIAPEEQKPLQKYFILLRKIFLFLIFIFLIFFYFNSMLNLLILLFYFIFSLFVEYKVNDLFKKSIIVYALIGILFFLSFKNMNLFVIETSLILLYGVTTASLIYNKREKNIYKIISYNSVFILIANLLFFI